MYYMADMFLYFCRRQDSMLNNKYNSINVCTALTLHLHYYNIASTLFYQHSGLVVDWSPPRIGTRMRCMRAEQRTVPWHVEFLIPAVETMHRYEGVGGGGGVGAGGNTGDRLSLGKSDSIINNIRMRTLC